MKVLFTSPILEHPAAGGPQLRIENSIKALSQICTLYLAARSPRHLTGGDQAEKFYRRYAREFVYAPSTAGLSRNRYIRKAQNILRNLNNRTIEHDAAFILNFIETRGIEYIWFGYGNISFPLIKRIKESRPLLRVVCDTDSVWSRFVLRELPHQTSKLRKARIKAKGKQKEREEREWVNLCEVTTAVSEVDAAYYRSIAKEPSRIRLFPNAIDLETYRMPPPPPAGFKKPCIYLAGTFGHYHSPMDIAARWVLEKIFPKVKEHIRDVHFYIVGKNSDRTLGHLQSRDVTVTGQLPSVLPYLCHADVALVPLKFESGTRFKILEAGACGIPVVSTSLGAEGLPVMDGRDILLADNPRDFAQAIVRLFREKDFAATLAKNCREMVRNRFSVECLGSDAKRILEALAA